MRRSTRGRTHITEAAVRIMSRDVTPRAPVTTNTIPPTSASAPTIGGSGIVFVVSCVASMGPMSRIVSSLVYVKPW